MTVTEMPPNTDRAAEQADNVESEESARLDQIEAKLGEIETLAREEADLLEELAKGHRLQREHFRRLLSIVDDEGEQRKAEVGRPTPQRPAREGEACVCGEPATRVLLFEEYGPVPYCGSRQDGSHRPADCPEWCVDEHTTPYDREHCGDIHSVELDAHPYQVRTTRTGGEWEDCRHSILVSIAKDSGDQPAYIGLVGHDDQPASHLTAYEAEQLADILQQLAAALRSEECSGRE